MNKQQFTSNQKQKNMPTNFLENAISIFESYKLMGEKAMAQLADEKLFWQFNAESNSIAMIAQHLNGNMLSRWTDFLTTDGEKDSRNRDAEFETVIKTKEELLQKWNEGWACMFATLKSLNENDLDKIVFIRSKAHTVNEAISRQLAHYSYHVGQLVFVAKMIANEQWKTLSIAKNESKKFNDEMFGK